MKVNQIIQGDTLTELRKMPSGFVDCIITSPPYYGLRDYGVEGQIGLEKTLDEYLDKMLDITKELKRVLKPTGTMFWNHGDSYGGNRNGNTNYNEGFNQRWENSPNRIQKQSEMGKSGIKRKMDTSLEKCMLLQNYRLALRMVDEQKWILRNIIIWHKPNVMPASVKDRFTVDYEPVFFFVKQKKYWFEMQYEKPIGEWGPRNRDNFRHGTQDPRLKHHGLTESNPNPLGRNKRCVWKIPTQPYKEAHFAVFPEKLVEPMIKSGCPEFICKKCGKAREKIENVDYIKNRPSAGNDKRSRNEDRLSNARGHGGWRGNNLLKQTRELGYTNCGCNAGWESGIVLDPFIGSGTVAEVARKLGRRWLGIELNPKYIEIAERRMRQKVIWEQTTDQKESINAGRTSLI